MSTINSLIMPSTIPDQATIRQLLLFSHAVFQFAPSEDSISPNAFADNYSHFAPVPFAEGLGTFQKFIKDLTSYRAEYYTGALSRLSSDLAADVDESCVWQLIDKLAQSAPSDPQTDTLMHARVLLKLAEIHHNEDDEINSALAAVNSKMSSLMSDLRDGGEEQLWVKCSSEPKTKSVKNPLQQLKAWCHLFLADNSERNYTIIATDAETLSTLYEYGSALISPQQKTVCKISLPPQCFSGSPENFIDLLNKFQRTRQEDITTFQATLLQAAEGNLPTKDTAEEFNRAIEDSFGACQGLVINLHTVPVPLPQLAAKITHTTPGTKAHNYPPSTLIAVIA